MTNFSWPGGPAAIADRLAEVAQTADATPLDTLWVADHPMQSDPACSPDEPMLDAYTTLGNLAGLTGRIRLGTLVSCASFRAPALLIKAVTTLDVLSGGRAWLGVGAGYNEAEARAMGVDLPPVPARFDRLIDTLELARRLWARRPLARSTGGAPCWRVRCRRRCRSAGRGRASWSAGSASDGRCRWWPGTRMPATCSTCPTAVRSVRRQLGVIARECAKLGRPYEEIETTVTTALREGESTADIVRRCRRLSEAGLVHVVVIARGRAFSRAEVELLGRAAEQLAQA